MNSTTAEFNYSRIQLQRDSTTAGFNFSGLKRRAKQRGVFIIHVCGHLPIATSIKKENDLWICLK